MSALERLKNLFRELFQLDVADLDFGIYRLLHLKRKAVGAFLGKDLPAAVDKEFKAAASAEQATLERDLKELADRIPQDIGPDVLLPNGEPAPTYGNPKLVRDYVATCSSAEAIRMNTLQRLPWLTATTPTSFILTSSSALALEAAHLASTSER